MCIKLGFANSWISQGESWGMCRFTVAEKKLRKPTLAEDRSDFLCSGSRQRR